MKVRQRFMMQGRGGEGDYVPDRLRPQWPFYGEDAGPDQRCASDWDPFATTKEDEDDVERHPFYRKDRE